MVRILLLDGQEIVRKGIRRLLESDPDFIVVGEASDGVQALRTVERLKPDVVVLELMLKGVGGLELLQQLQNRSAETKMVVLSMYGNEVYVVESLRAGAQAYVLKDSCVDELLAAIHSVITGRNFLCSSLAQHAFDVYLHGNGNGHNGNNHNEEDPYETLSHRERQILHLIVQEELSSTDIAERLLISRRTVESHRANIMRKLGLNSYSSLVRYAVQRGILLSPQNGEEKEMLTATSSTGTMQPERIA